MEQIQATIGPALERLLAFLIQLAIAGLVFFIGYRITQYARKLVRAALYRRDPETAARLYSVLNRVLFIAGVTLSLAAALAVMGLSLDALLASLGLASFGVVFALKDTLEQSFAGVYLLFERPFKEGDIVQVTDVEGSVEEVSIRTTNIRTNDGLLVLVPNKTFFTSNMINKTHYPTRRYTLVVGVGYNNDLRKAHEVILAAVKNTDGVLSDPPPSVSFEGFDALLVRASVRYWIEWKKTDGPATMTAVAQSIVEATQREAIEIQRPVQVKPDATKP